ncbi:MAG: TlpA disulfide reductase family protein [Bacteroidales bacterium]|jgi:peroxiredoxin|nr:TlpA disulfide reductase family protein [Bacteroidales bacterium]
MKNVLISLLFVVLLFSCTQEPKYSINGTIEGQENGQALLQQQIDGEWISLDSASIEKGKFVLEGSVALPEYFILKISDTLNPVQLFVENSKIDVNINIDSLANTEVVGSKSNLVFEKFNSKIDEFNLRMKSLYNEYMQANMGGDVEKVKEIEEKYSKVYDEQEEFMSNFVGENTSCVIAPFIVSRYMIHQLELKQLDSIVNLFDASLAQSKYITKINKRVSVLEKVAIGKNFTDFTMNDTIGNPVSLSDYVGKSYVLIDFWAAWCNPCRKENPNLVANYAKYHDKGFEIFGVSFDKKKEDWIRAIKKDNITWPQVSDLEYWNNAAGKLYGINSIPSNVLLDKEGKIIAKNVRGEDLGKKLEEIFE